MRLMVIKSMLQKEMGHLWWSTEIIYYLEALDRKLNELRIVIKILPRDRHRNKHQRYFLEQLNRLHARIIPGQQILGIMPVVYQIERHQYRHRKHEYQIYHSLDLNNISQHALTLIILTSIPKFESVIQHIIFAKKRLHQ